MNLEKNRSSFITPLIVTYKYSVARVAGCRSTSWIIITRWLMKLFLLASVICILYIVQWTTFSYQQQVAWLSIFNYVNSCEANSLHVCIQCKGSNRWRHLLSFSHLYGRQLWPLKLHSAMFVSEAFNSGTRRWQHEISKTQRILSRNSWWPSAKHSASVFGRIACIA